MEQVVHYYVLRNFEKVDACTLKTHPPFTFLNWTDNGTMKQTMKNWTMKQNCNVNNRRNTRLLTNVTVESCRQDISKVGGGQSSDLIFSQSILRRKYIIK